MSELTISVFTLEAILPEGQTALFNTLSQSICIMDHGVWEEIRRGNGYHGEQAYELLSRGFLVENGLDEESILTHWRLVQAYDLNHLTYYLQIGRQRAVMNHQADAVGVSTGGLGREMARNVLDFLILDMEAKRPVEVNFVFGGPDCLAHTRSLHYLAERLYLFCRGRNIRSKTTVLSFPSELQADRILNLKDYGLEEIRIVFLESQSETNPQANHDLISKVTALEGLVRMALEIQYDRQWDWRTGISALLDRLASRSLQSALQDIRIYPVRLDRGETASLFLPFPDCACQGNTENELWLSPKLMAHGFSCSSSPPQRRCPARYRSTTFIEPDGRISSCPCLSDHPELDYGHILLGIDFRKESLTTFQSIPAGCRSCPVAPLCDSGCRRLSPAQARDTASNGCRNQGLESVLLAYLKGHPDLVCPPSSR